MSVTVFSNVAAFLFVVLVVVTAQQCVGMWLLHLKLSWLLRSVHHMIKQTDVIFRFVVFFLCFSVFFQF